MLVEPWGSLLGPSEIIWIPWNQLDSPRGSARVVDSHYTRAPVRPSITTSFYTFQCWSRCWYVGWPCPEQWQESGSTLLQNGRNSVSRRPFFFCLYYNNKICFSHFGCKKKRFWHPCNYRKLFATQQNLFCLHYRVGKPVMIPLLEL